MNPIEVLTKYTLMNLSHDYRFIANYIYIWIGTNGILEILFKWGVFKWIFNKIKVIIMLKKSIFKMRQHKRELNKNFRHSQRIFYTTYYLKITVRVARIHWAAMVILLGFSKYIFLLWYIASFLLQEYGLDIRIEYFLMIMCLA